MGDGGRPLPRECGPYGEGKAGEAEEDFEDKLRRLRGFQLFLPPFRDEVMLSGRKTSSSMNFDGPPSAPPPGFLVCLECERIVSKTRQVGVSMTPGKPVTKMWSWSIRARGRGTPTVGMVSRHGGGGVTRLRPSWTLDSSQLCTLIEERVGDGETAMGCGELAWRFWLKLLVLVMWCTWGSLSHSILAVGCSRMPSPVDNILGGGALCEVVRCAEEAR